MAPPYLKQRMAARGPQFGCWLELFSPISAEVMAQAGYDLILVDADVLLLRDGARASLQGLRRKD
jgi:2-keto-3-deoxy-L-rhamnonate aldolase RhmA